MSPADIEAIERATIAAVAPNEVHEIGGFIVALDDGAIGRARSATPLRHDLAPPPAVLDEIEALYAARDLSPFFRIPDVPGLASLCAALAKRGYAPTQPTVVKVGPVAGLRAMSQAPAEMDEAPDAEWRDLFVKVDPAHGAAWARNFCRAGDAAFASVRESGRTLAVGVAAFGHGWASIHGMRTDPERRGEGLAGRVLAAIGEAAADRGLNRAFLQVEEPNAPARALYRRAGFTPLFRHLFWRR